MKSRAIYSGVIGSFLVIAPLWMIMYYIWPSRIQEEASLPTLFEIGGYLLIVFFIFGTGYVSAKWNWVTTRLEAMLDGGASGLIIGCICFLLVGGAGMGLMGNRVILQDIDKTISNENLGISHLVFSIISTARWTYLGFWAFVILGVVFGALGGIASRVKDLPGWGKMPHEKPKWLFRLPSYTLVFSGILNMIITMAALIPLRDSLSKTYDQVRDLLPASSFPDLIYYLGSLTAAMTFVIPLVVTMGFVLADWESRQSKRGLSYAWIVMCMLTLLSLFIFIGFRNFGLIAILLIPGFGIMYFVLRVSMKLVRKIPVEKYSLADWVAYVLLQGILGGTQIYIGALPFALSLVLIGVVNVPHLTLSGAVDQSLRSQVDSLFSVSSASGLMLMMLSGAFGLLTAWVVLFVRNFFFMKIILMRLR